jgi:DNA-binding NarL/FixJ family response regulator
MIKLALVDDDPRLLHVLKARLLQFNEIESVICCTSGMQFIKELASMSSSQFPEVIVMDISMGSADEGIRATQKIKELHPEIKIIMFTISDRDDLIFDAFKSGAMGYLLKSESPEFIVKTILDVNSGEAQMSPSIARKTIEFLTSQRKPAEKENADFALSQRELDTINLVAKGYTYGQIGELLHIAPNTAKKHMTNIFAKLNVKNKIEALIKTSSYRELHHS